MVFVVISALVLDRCFGEPRLAHPLIAFGRMAHWLEKRCYGSANTAPLSRRLRGLSAMGIAILPATAGSAALVQLPYLGTGIEIVLLYLTLGARSLTEHASGVQSALLDNDLAEARRQVGRIVSRETNAMQETDVARATIESVLENGNDAIFGALFWYIVAGAPGAVMYRLVNTLDAMWGYRNNHYLYFGWAAARFDDVLNYFPARLTAFSYAIAGNFNLGLQCWRLQAKVWESPNAGPVMAAGAGSLALRLGGAATYHGKIKQRPELGAGMIPGAKDIERALKLVRHSTILWLIVITLGGLWLA